MQRSAKLGYLCGTMVALAAIIFFSLPAEQQLLAKGRMNTGHEQLQCRDCHLPAAGSFRQQLQSNVKGWLGLRSESADFGYLPVGNEGCLDCHARPNDKHPISRFLEPRFVEARKAIQPQHCNSCHSEHSGKRVTINATYCLQCHQDLKVKDDPSNIKHEQLVSEKNWQSCLMCHDFHGNHLREAPKDLNQGITVAQIEAYFSGSSSPYGQQRQFQAKKERQRK